MKSTDFQKWLAQSDMLTPSQRQRALDVLSTTNIGQSSYSLIEEWIADDRKCPLCHTSEGARYGMTNGLQRYRCNHCGRTFLCWLRVIAMEKSLIRFLRKWMPNSLAQRSSLSLDRMLFFVPTESNPSRQMTKEAGIAHQALNINGCIGIK